MAVATCLVDGSLSAKAANSIEQIVVTSTRLPERADQVPADIANARPPVTQSEFGSSSYYLLPARSVFVSLGALL